jgi:hypothetical protein
MPTVEIALLNRGSRRVLVTEAQISIVSYAELNACVGVAAEGPLRVSAAYDVAMPVRPLPRERALRVPVDQQIGPDGADRFGLTFAAREPSEEREDLYAIDVRLQTTDSPNVVDVGRSVIAVPGALGPRSRAGVYLPFDDQTLTGFASPKLALDATWCYRQNLASATKVLGTRGSRSRELSETNYLTPAPGWARLRDRTPPRPAAMQLAGYPALAVFAASQTRDRSLIATIRARSAHSLLTNARTELSQSAQPTSAQIAEAIENLKASIEAQDSSDAQSLLADAQSRLHVP